LERELLRLILNYQFYKENKNRILEGMFPSNLISLYKLICETHEKLNKDIGIIELKELYKATYPTATTAHLENVFIILDNLPKEISNEVCEEILKKAYIVELGRRITEIGIQIVNGETSKFTEIQSLIEKANSGRISEFADLEPVTKELEELLEQNSEITKWKFNIGGLKDVAQGLGPGVFKAAFGRVETGKTAYGISLLAAPQGFAEQGAKCFFYANEEPAKRSQIRAISSFTGMNLQEILLEPTKTKKLYSKIKDNLTFFDIKGKTIIDIETHIEKHKPDIVVWDQLDKIEIAGTFARTDERLGALYMQARDICVRQGCGGIALSQANAEAEGHAYMASTNMALSRTAKAAECDILIGIGKNPKHDDRGRTLNVIKNKILGNHTAINCVIQPELSRYHD
jgi:hypothetical protein